MGKFHQNLPSIDINQGHPTDRFGKLSVPAEGPKFPTIF